MWGTVDSLRLRLRLQHLGHSTRAPVYELLSFSLRAEGNIPRARDAARVPLRYVSIERRCLIEHGPGVGGVRRGAGGGLESSTHAARSSSAFRKQTPAPPRAPRRWH
eukprot:1242955-Rhodomonas_salina.1